MIKKFYEFVENVDIKYLMLIKFGQDNESYEMISDVEVNLIEAGFSEIAYLDSDDPIFLSIFELSGIRHYSFADDIDDYRPYPVVYTIPEDFDKILSTIDREWLKGGKQAHDSPIQLGTS